MAGRRTPHKAVLLFHYEKLHAFMQIQWGDMCLPVLVELWINRLYLDSKKKGKLVSPGLLDAIFSDSFGVLKSTGSLGGLLPPMLMLWTWTMYSVSSSRSQSAQERVVVFTSWMNRSMRTSFFCRWQEIPINMALLSLSFSHYRPLLLAFHVHKEKNI